MAGIRARGMPAAFAEYLRTGGNRSAAMLLRSFLPSTFTFHALSVKSN